MSFNGQRCTAIKLVIVHESRAKEFVQLFSERVSALKYGLPWEKGVTITPLPEGELLRVYVMCVCYIYGVYAINVMCYTLYTTTLYKYALTVVALMYSPYSYLTILLYSFMYTLVYTGQKKLDFLQSLLVDALAKGASIINAAQGGGDIHGMLIRPAVVYPVTPDMRLYYEEQFGPIVPIATYKDISEIHTHYINTKFGLQASIFTQDSLAAAPIIDILSTNVGRINLNTQCGRSPDSLPFSGRKSSALGTMSIAEAYRAFSVETVVAGKATEGNIGLMKQLNSEGQSKFLLPL